MLCPHAGLAELGSGEAWQQTLRKWEELFRRTDELAHGWLSHAAKLVAACMTGASVNTNGASSRRPDGQVIVVVRSTHPSRGFMALPSQL